MCHFFTQQILIKNEILTEIFQRFHIVQFENFLKTV